MWNRLLLTSAAWSCAALAACSDSQHLYPTPTGGSGENAGSGGGAVVCDSNSDCPTPTAVCDSIKNQCVECLVLDDCGFRPGTICSLGVCQCPSAGASFCEPFSDAAQSRDARCVDLQTSSADCGSCAHACFGSCSAGECVDAWEPTPLFGAPEPRTRHVAVWTGAVMIVWGGETAAGNTNTGGMLDLSTNKWTATSAANAPVGRTHAAGVWTGTHLVVWGGHGGGALGTGAVFDPATNTWTAMSNAGAPAARYQHSIVWAPPPIGKVLVWGGNDGSSNTQSGGRYDPATDEWTPITTSNAPTQRREHATVWSEDRMIVFGGIGFDEMDNNGYLSTGGLYDPAADAWAELATAGAPSPRSRASAVGTGTEVLIWGGFSGADPPFLASGAKYGVASGWTPMTNQPDARHNHAAVWAGAKMIVWGGEGMSGRLDSGGLFDPAANAWDANPMPTAPVGRANHSAVSTGTKMIVWGGETAGGLTQSGAVFDTMAGG